ncbi:hypothetical protein K439DRAFT_1418954 [Ramaria rubella]|nr:hypothetical protein K439DRAFT_1418954 [Ramaria rubella]
MPFYIGKFSEPLDSARIVHLQDPVETELLRDGDIVERWDHVFEWDSQCVKASRLEEWRAMGDPLCDAALRSMFTSASSSTGVDLLERLQSDAALNPEGPSQDLLDDVSLLPPNGIAATPLEIREAHTFFLQHSVAIMQCLMHFSLAGGFASPRITRALQAVSYLVPPRKNSTHMAEITPELNDRTYSRLLETFQFVLDVMACTNTNPLEKSSSCLDPGGDGWKAALRVRLLHGVARRRILERLSLSANSYSVEDDGIPVNQEDMAATLASFSVAPLWCLRRVYLLPISPPTLSQRSSFIATWRHIGFYLGVDPTILRTHFSSPNAADKFLGSSVLHLLTSERTPPGSLRPLFPTIPILLASSDRPPFPRSFEHQCALTRHLLGSALSTHLGVPPSPVKVEFCLLLSLIMAQIPVLFSCIYPRRGWSDKRAALTREALARVVRFQLGMRRTTFRARNEHGEVGDEVLSLETVKPDTVGGKKLVKEYRALMLEMAGVISGVMVLVIAGMLGWNACLLSSWYFNILINDTKPEEY